jgi:UDP-glucose 4-epimerase
MAALKSANESMILPDLYTTNNVVGSFNIISHAIKSKIKKIIFSSTAAVYGKPLYNPIDEKHQTNPINHYGYTKLCVENHLSWMSKINDMKYVSLRYFNAAGYTDKEDLIRFKENNPQNLLPIIMEVANNKREKLEIFGNDYNTKDGTCIRDYINVVDLADAHVKALEYLESGFSCNLNLSTGRGYSVLDVVNTAKEITGKDIPFTFSSRRVGDPEILISSYAKANEKLKWIPVKSSLEQLIKSMWKYYR